MNSELLKYGGSLRILKNKVTVFGDSYLVRTTRPTVCSKNRISSNCDVMRYRQRRGEQVE